MNEKPLSVNIDADAVVEQYEREHAVNSREKTEFSPKYYLQARLTPGETSKTLTIRLLPFSPEGGTPFKKVHIHTVKVNKELSPGGWKTFVCPVKNDSTETGVTDKRCPFCDTSQKARELKDAATTEAEKKKYGDIEYMNRAKAAWIVRCIERGHEEDGVKFWLFNDSAKKDGVYDKIMNIYHQRKEAAERKGKTSNIFDVNDGKDIIISLSKDANNKTVTKIVDDEDKSPLTNNYEQGMAWINDAKKWSSIYTPKSYDYMAIALQDGVPVYDKANGKYVDKTELLKQAQEESERQLTEKPIDYSSSHGEGNDDNVEVELPF